MLTGRRIEDQRGNGYLLKAKLSFAALVFLLFPPTEGGCCQKFFLVLEENKEIFVTRILAR